MTNFPHLTHAPIREAVLYIKCTLADPNSPERFKQLSSKLPRRYKRSQEINTGKVEVSIEEGRPSSISTQARPLGFQFHAPDHKFLASFRFDGLSLSKLAPYSTWEELSEELAHLWEFYKEAAGTLEVQGVSTRFINALNLGNEGLSLSEYLTGAPELPPTIDGTLESALSRLDFRCTNPAHRVVTTQALQSADEDQERQILLDIDVINDFGNFEKEDLLWEQIEGLRDAKNSVFFSMITNKTVEICT